jgi:hypothetical protein
MFTLLDSGPSGADRVGLMAKLLITLRLRCFVQRSNDSHFRMMAMNVKYFLCDAQRREIVDKSMPYVAYAT